MGYEDGVRCWRSVVQMWEICGWGGCMRAKGFEGDPSCFDSAESKPGMSPEVSNMV